MDLRRGAAALLLVPLLAGCAPAGMDPAEALALDIRGQYLQADRGQTRAAVTADYGRRVCEFVLDVEWTPEETRVTVLQPETVAGITATVQAGESTLEYDGLSLDTGPLDKDGLAPVSAVPVLLTAAAEGFITQCRMEPEGSLLRVDCGDPEGAPGTGRQTTLWFDKESGSLRRGEILVDGFRVISCEFLTFTKETSEGEDP